MILIFKLVFASIDAVRERVAGNSAIDCIGLTTTMNTKSRYVSAWQL